MPGPYFTQETFDFLSALAVNNNRDWFLDNKQAYEESVRTPALAFIADIATDLALISPHFLAQPRKVGGSLMRVNRDIRFGRDKRPYKTNIGIQFRHEVGKDVHAPGFYVHIENDSCFVGVGVWRPGSSALAGIRDAIVEDGDAWLVVRDNTHFRKHFTLEGDALKSAPRGYPRSHPLIEDIRRKDFIAIANVTNSSVMSKEFLAHVVDHFAQATPFMAYLCKALALRF